MANRKANGIVEVNGIDVAESGYQYTHQYMGKPRPISIIIIGAGVSGIAAVKLFKEKFVGQPVDLRIYEKNADVTGTWLENRYPGYKKLLSYIK
jgi:ribulose 1,5-bisphosphate synthetase/thiazole synthase